MTPSLRLVSVHLRVSDLSRSIDFYGRKLGFTLHRQNGANAELGAGTAAPSILHLAEHRDAPRPRRETAGLFHAALLFPRRAELGAWLQSAAQHGVDFEGFSDHGVSEAVYLSDPDGNGLEFYTDRPRASWPLVDGELAMITKPLDVRGLLAEGANANPAPMIGAAWGHLHLRVTDLEHSESFYRTTLGLEVTQRSYPGARFMAADGYHHHLGLNTWGGPRLPQPPDALGLAFATFARAGQTNESSAIDPDGIHLRLQPALVPA